jgi:hypothetical protein
MPDWRLLSREAGFKVSGTEIALAFSDGRQHSVTVEERPDRQGLRLWAIAARPSMLPEEPEGPHVHAWKRNRASDLVGFKIDGRGRLVGEACVPLAGLDLEEWTIYVNTVARACDRVEYLLSGRDEL